MGNYISTSHNELTQESLETYANLINMGFDDELSMTAVRKYGNNINKCTDFIVSKKQEDENKNEEKVYYENNMCQGYLDVQSLHSNRFSKQWVVLHENSLCLFQNKNDEKPSEIINLKLVSEITKSLNNENKFNILSKQSKRSFIGRSYDHTNHWIQHIIKKLPSWHSTQNATVMKNANTIIPININCKGEDHDIDNKKFVIWASYTKAEKIENIFNCIKKKYHPISIQVVGTEEESFTGEKCVMMNEQFMTAITPLGQQSSFASWLFGSVTDIAAEADVSNQPLTNHKKNDILRKGLVVEVSVQRVHNVKGSEITCKHMKQLNSTNPLKCPIYFKMRKKYERNEKNLVHLNAWDHFINEYDEKPKCKYFDECKAYLRLENGDNNINDLCHMKIFRHPPRNRHIKLSENINSFVFNKNERQNHPTYETTKHDLKKYNYNKMDGWLNALIAEVIKNGYKSDLCLKCTPNDECKHDDHSILQIVDDKMECCHHKSMNKPLNRGLMMALILYTGCECNYDLCTTQRNGDYTKWRWFDRCLYYAIFVLSMNESGSFRVYSGLNSVKLDKKSVSSGYFVTYVSSSWNKHVAQSFMKGQGMMIQIDKKFKDHFNVNCCDVSWVSKLFARSTTDGLVEKFKCVVLDESNGIQTVAVRTRS